MLKNVNTEMNTDLYNEFAWAQENFDAGDWWEISNLIVVA